jgi:cytoskeletal protein CcmA (bactofilin family)
VVKGTEVNTEFDNIATAVATKANLAGPTFTGTTTAANLTVSGTFTGTIDGGTY